MLWYNLIFETEKFPLSILGLQMQPRRSEQANSWALVEYRDKLITSNVKKEATLLIVCCKLESCNQGGC